MRRSGSYMKKKSWGAGFALKMLCCGGGVLVLAVLLARFVPSALPDAKAAQVRAVNIALRQAVGRVVFCVTKDTIVIAAVDDGAAAALRAPGSTPPRPPAIAPLGAGRVAVVLGAIGLDSRRRRTRAARRRIARNGPQGLQLNGKDRSARSIGRRHRIHRRDAAGIRAAFRGPTFTTSSTWRQTSR